MAKSSHAANSAYNTVDTFHEELFRPLEGDSLNKDRSVDKKYKEIKDKKTSPNRKSSPTVNLGHPSINNISSCIESDINDDSKQDDMAIQRGNDVKCPTCRGTGVIQTDDSSLVALIPVKDERLKPKRIKLKVSLSIFITLVLCGITVFFLFPRSPTLELLSVVSHNVSFSSKQDPYIIIKVKYRAKNDNFVSVKLTSLSVEVTWYNFQVGSQPMHDFDTVTVKARSSTTFIVYVNTTYSKPTAKKIMRHWCLFDVAFITVKIETELNSSFLFHDEKVSSENMKGISCHYNSTA